MSGPDRAPVAVPLDVPDAATAAALAAAVAPYVSTVKIGLELFCALGPAGTAAVHEAAAGTALFLDLKLHDIPATVAGAVRSVLPLAPRLLTVHASGGPAMVAAAAEAAEGSGTIITAVTVLTSLDGGALEAVGLLGPPDVAVLRLATMAVAAGAGALVCSPLEAAQLRAEVGPDVLLVTPGVRPAGSGDDDQARVATPERALADGADLLVIGRPITRSPDPAAAARDLAARLAGVPRAPR
jgi:orotidine-5'-phosphate decarboxylase